MTRRQGFESPRHSQLRFLKHFPHLNTILVSGMEGDVVRLTGRRRTESVSKECCARLVTSVTLAARPEVLSNDELAPSQARSSLLRETQDERKLSLSEPTAKQGRSPNSFIAIKCDVNKRKPAPQRGGASCHLKTHPSQ